MADSTKEEVEWIDTAEYFVDIIIELATEDDRVVLVGADTRESFLAFVEKFPDRYFDFGVAEQNACGHAAGLAFAGKKPFFCTIAPFATMRCFEQIRNDIVKPSLPVAIVGKGAGVSYGTAGATHQGIDEMGILRILPGLTIVDSADLSDFENAVREAVKLQGPIYLRAHKQLIKTINPEGYHFELGKGVVLKEGSDVTIIACGTMVNQSVLASQVLERYGISAGVVSMHTIKPIDEELVNSISSKTNKVVTVEEHSIVNGLGSAVADILVKRGKARQLRIGFDGFPSDGPYMELIDYHGLSGPKIAERVRDFVKD